MAPGVEGPLTALKHASQQSDYASTNLNYRLLRRARYHGLKGGTPMTIRIASVALVCAVLAGPAAFAQAADPVPAAATSAAQMTTAARALLASLGPDELKATLFALDADERSHWSNVPYQAHHRPGLRLGGLNREQMLR